MAKCLKTAIHKLILTQQLVPDSSNYIYDKKFSAHHKHNLIPFVISAYTFKVSELAEIKIKSNIHYTAESWFTSHCYQLCSSYVCMLCSMWYVHFVPVFLCLWEAEIEKGISVQCLFSISLLAFTLKLLDQLLLVSSGEGFPLWAGGKAMPNIREK